MNPSTHRRNRGLVWLAATAAAAGIGIGAAGIANAASSTSGSTGVSVSASTSAGSTSANTSATTPAPPSATPQDPASMSHGPGETVLTGDTATKVKAAVEAAEPGATIIRLETDSGGHAYEAHIKQADGTVKTLYFTTTFTADGSDTGFGGGPAGAPHGQPPAQSGSTTGA